MPIVFINLTRLRIKLGGVDAPVHPSTIYRMIARGLLPPPHHPSPGVSRWIEEEVDEAIAKLIGRDPQAAEDDATADDGDNDHDPEPLRPAA